MEPWYLRLQWPLQLGTLVSCTRLWNEVSLLNVDSGNFLCASNTRPHGPGTTPLAVLRHWRMMAFNRGTTGMIPFSVDPGGASVHFPYRRTTLHLLGIPYWHRG